MKKLKIRKVKPSYTSKAIASRVRKMDALEPIRPCRGRFVDYIIDMYDEPDQIELRRVYSGPSGARQDAVNMRSYFNTARRNILSGN